MPSQNDGMPSPITETPRTAWSAARSRWEAAMAANGRVMATAMTVAIATSPAVSPIRCAMIVVTGRPYT